jgi:hypothetical protein
MDLSICNDLSINRHTSAMIFTNNWECMCASVYERVLVCVVGTWKCAALVYESWKQKQIELSSTWSSVNHNMFNTWQLNEHDCKDITFQWSTPNSLDSWIMRQMLLIVQHLILFEIPVSTSNYSYVSTLTEHILAFPLSARIMMARKHTMMAKPWKPTTTSKNHVNVE